MRNRQHRPGRDREEEDAELLRRHTDDVSGPSVSNREAANSSKPVEQLVRQVVGQTGQPLPNRALARIEPRVGSNLDHVRVHTDGTAKESAEALRADAYTIGHHIVFGSGKYRPDTSSGQDLLAHEATHTLQTGTSTPSLDKLSVSDPDSAPEREARRVAADRSQSRFSKGPTAALEDHIHRQDTEAAGAATEDRVMTEEEQIHVLSQLAILATKHPFFMLVQAAIRTSGYEITGGAVGLILSGVAAAMGGFGGSAGLWGMVEWPDGDVSALAAGDLGADVGIQYGGGPELGIAWRLSKVELEGADSEGEKEFGGLAYGLSASAGLGGSLYIGDSLRADGSGWLVLTVGVGAELGGTLGYRWGTTGEFSSTHEDEGTGFPGFAP